MSEVYTADQVGEVLGAVALEKLREHTTSALAATHRPHGGGTPRRPTWRTHAELERLVDWPGLDSAVLKKINQKCNRRYPTYYVDWGSMVVKRHREDWDLDGAEKAIGEVIAKAETMVATADIRRVSVAYDVPAEWLRKLVKAAGFNRAVRVGLKTLGYEKPWE